MAPHAIVRNQIYKLCGQEETRRDALELYNIAAVKTGPGTGHELGKTANAIGPICALLASERLGNNDVTKKVAQDVSCLRPQDFSAALSLVRKALSEYLTRKKRTSPSYRDLCRLYRFNDDALYWMEEVDKEVRKDEELDQLEVDEDSIIYMVFYWTCVALNMRSVKRATIISEFGVALQDFQDIEYVLDRNCQKVRESIDKFVSEARLVRTKQSGPSAPTKGSRIPATPRKLEGETSPLKRKVVLPPLPFMTPTKKVKTSTAIPTRLNRLPVTSSIRSPSKSPTKAMESGATPVKTYSASRSFADPLSKEKHTVSKEENSELENESELTRSPNKQLAFADLPVTPSKNRISHSPQKPASPQKQHDSKLPLTPTPRRTQNRVTFSTRRASMKLDIVETPDVEDDSVKLPTEENEPPCRHRLPVFSDRLYHHYRDPRIVREWETCEANMKMMVEKLGDALGQIVAY